MKRFKDTKVNPLLPIEEISYRWKALFGEGLNLEDSRRKDITIQVLENSCHWMSLHEEEENLYLAREENETFLFPLIRSIIPNLEAFDLPEIEVIATKGSPRISWLSPDLKPIQIETKPCLFAPLTSLKKRPDDLWDGCFSAIYINSELMATTAQTASNNIDAWVRGNYERNPAIILAIYALYLDRGGLNLWAAVQDRKGR